MAWGMQAEAQSNAHPAPTIAHGTLVTPGQCVHRYLLYGDVSFRVAEEMRKPEVSEFFSRLIQRVAPKSWDQASAGHVKRNPLLGGQAGARSCC